MYDVIIIGAGVIGASIARELSKYELNTLVLEKENDVGDGASGANSAIIHSGYDPLPSTLKATFNVKGNAMYDEIAKDLGVEFKRIGSITLALNMEEKEKLEQLRQRAIKNNVDVKIIEKEELKKIEPSVTSKAVAGLLAPSCGIINPFVLVVALMENAIENGIKLNLNEEVIKIERLEKGFKVTTSKTSYVTNYVINAAGINADIINAFVNEKFFTITPKKGEYYVLDHFDNNYVKHTLFSLPSAKGKGVLISPTTSYNYLIGPSSNISSREDVSTDSTTLETVLAESYKLIDNVRVDKKIKQFAGIRAVSSTNDFIIEETSYHFINVSGIQSPGLSSAPAIATFVASLIENKKPNEHFNPKRRPFYQLNKLSFDERCKLIENEPRFSQIVCRCEKVSLMEVIDVINRPCGAKTIKGVKKRIRPGFGMCQGGFCEPLILNILSKELKCEKQEIFYGKNGSYILEENKRGTCDEKI